MSSTDRYYQLSGKFPPDGPVLGLLGGVVAAIVLAFVYAYATVYIPVIGYITFLLSIGFGFALGFAPNLIFHARHVRNLAVVRIVVFAVALIGLWASWVAWVFAVCHRGGADFSLIELASSPAALWDLVVRLNEVGTWSFKGSTPTGAVLWVLWAIEALLIVGLAGLVGLSYGADEAYCEACRSWCTDDDKLPLLAAASDDEVRQHLESKSWGALEALGAPAADAKELISLHLHVCGCGRTNAVTAKRDTISLNSKGEASKSSSVVVDRLLLELDDVARLRSLAVRAPAAAPAEPSVSAG